MNLYTSMTEADAYRLLIRANKFCEGMERVCGVVPFGLTHDYHALSTIVRDLWNKEG